MSDRLEQFESELAQMRPRAASPDWSRRIESRWAIERRSDRRLIGAMSIGALAACFIVAMLLEQSTGPARSSPAIAATSPVPRLGTQLQAFALTSGPEIWK